MLYRIILLFLLAFSLTTTQVLAVSVPKKQEAPIVQQQKQLASKTMSLNKRYANKFVNDVFKDNILLTLLYMTGKVSKASDISWTAVQKNATYELVLQPGEVFAFHDDVLPEYRNNTIKTTNAHFNAQDGFKTDGLLYGDGVCHLASLMNWTAQESGLKVEARVRHDFAPVPEIPREYGTSIFTTGTPSYTAEVQNLYITNTFDKPVHLVFHYENGDLTFSITK